MPSWQTRVVRDRAQADETRALDEVHDGNAQVIIVSHVSFQAFAHTRHANASADHKTSSAPMRGAFQLKHQEVAFRKGIGRRRR